MYEVFYPSGAVRKDGVLLLIGSQEYADYLYWLSLDNGPVVREDPPPPPQVVVNLGQMLTAFAQTHPVAHAALLSGLPVASDDGNVVAICDNLGLDADWRFAVFSLASTIDEVQQQSYAAAKNPVGM